MSYTFRSDLAIADAAFDVEAPDLPGLFAEAGRALVNLQVENLEDLRPRRRVTMALSAPDRERLLYRFLQEILYWKDAAVLLLLPESIRITEDSGQFHLRAHMKGERLDLARHRMGTDVKAVTWHRFNVTKATPGWRATIVVDV